MKIKVLSDLHLEFGPKIEQFFEAPDVDVLVLAGDIAVGYRDVASVLKMFGEHYKQVIYVPGNHDYWGTHILGFNLKLEELLKDTPNVHFLQNKSVKIEDVTFIGSTLFTNFQDDWFAQHSAKDMINDFHQIKRCTPHYYTQLHKEAVAYIKQAYELAEGKKVVVTHFLPVMESVHPKYARDTTLNKYYASNYGEWLATMSNTTWIHGHTHESFDYRINDTRVICNPYGYFRSGLNPNHDAGIYEV